MYFPYLRGRQYELLAIQTLAKKNLLSENIIPVIEPVKFSSTLINTVSEFINVKHRIGVIGNPVVGNFSREWKAIKGGSKEEASKNRFADLYRDDLIIKSAILNKSVGSLFEKWDKNHFSRSDMLFICKDSDMLEIYESLSGDFNPAYILMPDESSFRRRIRQRRVLLADSFEKQARNIDYSDTDDEFFSENHLYYQDDGYIGFSDYSIIGDVYSETGFAPYAVAIHIVYFSENRALRVKHFVSDSNDDINNPALKFFEAVSKLNDWYLKNKDNVVLTNGLNSFLQHFQNQTYPGLGTVKKLSVMHHLELMSFYFDKVK